jgi:hypothetical protein
MAPRLAAFMLFSASALTGSVALACGPTAVTGMQADAACGGRGATRFELDALKAEGFTVNDDARRQRLALGLLDCLGHPDPALRDGIAYEALSTWLRADALTLETRTTLLERLQEIVVSPDPDGILASCVGPMPGVEPPGFRAPFAALVLSEVARTDRIAAWLTPAQRATLVADAAGYVEGVRDWRGYDEKEGWRHGVAHGSDLLMQLALNPALDKAQLDAILAAVASQVAPPAHFYIYGEPERLARPVLFVLQRNLHDDVAWRAWLAQVSAPAPLAAWGDAFSSQAGLARRHDTRAFLLALYAGLAGSDDATMQTRAAAVAEALQAVG